jgi:HlyD family secretion protein
VRQVREGPITVQNVVTYDVVVDVKNDDLALFPGMTADAHIIEAERQNVLRVPLPAIRFNPEGLRRQRWGRGAGGGSGQGRTAEQGERAPSGQSEDQGQSGAAVFEHSRGEAPPGAGAPEGAGAGHPEHRTAAAGEASRARIWVMRNGKLVPVRVRTGLDDGTLIEVAGEDLREGDVVVVNAVRPNEARSGAERPGQNNGPGGTGFRGGVRF